MREMLRGICLKSGSSLVAVGALASGIAMLSCGGGGDQQGIVSPTWVASGATANNQGTVTSLARQSQPEAVCHYDKTLGTYSTLNLTPQGVAAHLANHPLDKAGACVVPCPCFGAGDYATAVDFCLSASSKYTICNPDSNSFDGVVFNLVACPADGNPTFTYEQSLDTTAHSCSREQTDSATTTVTALSAAQEAACMKIILDNRLEGGACGW